MLWETISHEIKTGLRNEGYINQRSECIVKSWVYSKVYEIKPPGSLGAVMV